MDVNTSALEEFSDLSVSAKDGTAAESREVSRHMLAAIFDTGTADDQKEVLRGDGFVRCRRQLVGGAVLIDRFDMADVECASLRIIGAAGRRLIIGVSGVYQLHTVAAGGWLLTRAEAAGDSYWIPQPPMLRRLDQDGHILSYRKSEILEFIVSGSGIEIGLEPAVGFDLDLVVWRLPAREIAILQSLKELNSLERQRYFLWSSHTAYERPADLYHHLVHGHIYENHEVWPKFWRVCSELDAYALYVTLSGLFRATGKKIYDLLRMQAVFSVIARQSSDGGWYHGEWTDGMESHYRLHAGGMHMLAAHFEETHDPTVGSALDRAATFAAARTDSLRPGLWFLHDSLEKNEKSLDKYPFRYIPNRALGKSKSNLLVLNTHLDTNIALARHRQVRDDFRYDALIASARNATHAVIAMRPADWLYRPLFWAIRLTFLPVDRAQSLSLPLRAIKRIAWKYLIPLLPRIKAVYPRLVMPGGYIERELTMLAFSVRYQPVNLMDLVRTRRLFDDNELDQLLAESFAFTHACGIKDRWKEFKGKEDDSLGFWAEALYHLSLVRSDIIFRDWLGESMIDLYDNGLGMPPSFLGSNAEAVAPDLQRPCPCPVDPRIRVANLSRGDAAEWLIVNPSDQTVALEWQSAPADEMFWSGSDSTVQKNFSGAISILPRAWIHAVSPQTSVAKP